MYRIATNRCLNMLRSSAADVAAAAPQGPRPGASLARRSRSRS
nr:hypothetical protein [Streptomyces natalensis]